MKNRVFKLIGNVLLLLFIGLSYAILIYKTGFYIPCVFHRITGFECPGCGISHMCMSILKFIFLGFDVNYLMIAFKSNPFIVIMSPIFLYLVSKYSYIWIKTGKLKETKFDIILIYIILILTILWGIFRNI